jgi:predicted methyltransferase
MPRTHSSLGAGSRAAYLCFALTAAVALVATSALAQMGILDDPHRPDAERARDAGSKPLQVYEWLGIEPGMTVGDIVPSGGYNSFILAKVVGPQGHVYAVGTNEAGQQRLEERFADAMLGNVDVMQQMTGVPDESVDVYVCVRNVHDMLIPDVAERYGMQPDPIMQEAYRSLKPGGTFGVVDVRTTMVEGADANTHRVNEHAVVELLESYGFEYVDSSDLLANPDDDHSQNGFGDGDTRFTLDRMLLKFRKPAM